ncbi:hypothetical protein CANARDRAFT_27841 [[Candida] arabinofermentans NRRL YB-2248]|uniref:60S acidic ribosomal protein P1 n=1 Tax=[Candida] arabinofermentans NRRL YB-2248 TaxID=983967 RepID=A0A1E4T230_9ASCO|nr:hypothetical protein CANARDRAFT_27841 [[Candida] arabinofermentans NRRL YB-2248]
MSTESALSYAALILSDSDLEISTENLLKLTSGAKIEIDNIWAQIYAKALAGQDLQSLFFNFSAAPAAGAAGASSAAGAASGAAAEEEEEVVEEKEESDDDMGFGLFD